VASRSVCHASLEDINRKKEHSNVKTVEKVSSPTLQHKQCVNSVVAENHQLMVVHAAFHANQVDSVPLLAQNVKTAAKVGIDPKNKSQQHVSIAKLVGRHKKEVPNAGHAIKERSIQQKVGIVPTVQ
jgi:hypothetical protein